MNLEPGSGGRLERKLAERKGKEIAGDQEDSSEQVCLIGLIESSLGKCNNVPQSPLIHEKHRFSVPLTSSPFKFFNHG